jgi:HEAT repeat protein
MLVLVILLVLVLIVSMQIAVFVKTCDVVRDYHDRRLGESKAVQLLGGEDEAASRLFLYVRMPAQVAPCRDEALILMGYAGVNGLRNLVALSSRSRGQLRVEAVNALAGHQEKEAVLAVIDATQDEYWAVRERAIRVLSFAGAEEEAVRAAERGLSDESGIVRWSAAEVLQKCGGPSSIPALERAIRVEPSGSDLRQEMQDALAAIQDRAKAQQNPPPEAVQRP